MSTLSYYNQHAYSFALDTSSANMSDAQNRFLAYLNRNAEKLDVGKTAAKNAAQEPETGDGNVAQNVAAPTSLRILDWGCGSGRDALAFKNLGYEVEATDGAEELCKIASEQTGIAVRHELFEDLKAKDYYNGIWACASLLHARREELPSLFQKAITALKQDGVMYASFKYGEFAGERNGRYFTDLDEDKAGKLLAHFTNIELLDMWTSADVREGREDEKWLNIIIQKTASR